LSYSRVDAAGLYCRGYVRTYCGGCLRTGHPVCFGAGPVGSSDTHSVGRGGPEPVRGINLLLARTPARRVVRRGSPPARPTGCESPPRARAVAAPPPNARSDSRS